MLVPILLNRLVRVVLEVMRESSWKSWLEQVEGTLQYRLVRVVLEVMRESCWKSCLEQVEGTLRY